MRNAKSTSLSVLYSNRQQWLGLLHYTPYGRKRLSVVATITIFLVYFQIRFCDMCAVIILTGTFKWGTFAYGKWHLLKWYLSSFVNEKMIVIRKSFVDLLLIYLRIYPHHFNMTPNPSFQYDWMTSFLNDGAYRYDYPCFLISESWGIYLLS